MKFLQGHGRHQVLLGFLLMLAIIGLASHAIAQTMTVLHSFRGSDGANPVAGLVQGNDGNLYGVADGVPGSGKFGTIFMMDGTTRQFLTLHEFSNGDGASPWGGLVQGNDGKFYGTTFTGGMRALGVVFMLDLASPFVRTLVNFTGENGANPATMTLIQSTDGAFYGTTSSGGTGDGTVFRMAASGALTVLHVFNGMNPYDGARPGVGLIQATDVNFYGTTDSGGFGHGGTVFRYNPRTNGLEILHAFSGRPDGLVPHGRLLEAADGLIYGSTQRGGANDRGTLFRIDPRTGALETVYSFSEITSELKNNDGANPAAGLIQTKDGFLYGTASNGGAFARGTIFQFDPTTLQMTTVYSFGASPADGATPFAALIQGSDGNLYGTTSGGGEYSSGTVFQVQLSAHQNFTLTYAAGANGAISGTSPQTVALGGDGSPVTAVPDPGYHFVSWSDGLQTTARTDTNVMADLNVTATFAINTYTLSVMAAGTGSGSVTPVPIGSTASFDFNTKVTLTAAPGAGSLFTGWSGACAGTTSTCVVTMAQAQAVTANFTLQQFTLTVAASGTGTGAVSPVAAGTSVSFDYNSRVTLTAAAAPGSTFTGWSGDCSGTDTCTVVMTQARNVTAAFTVNTFILAYTAGPGGSINGTSPQTINYGASGTAVSAVPNAGHHFVRWSDGLLTDTRTDSNVTANLAVVASFAPNTYALTVVAAGNGTGSVTPVGVGSNATYDYDTEVTLTATAATGSVFTGWSGACGGASTCTVRMTQAQTVTATFLLQQVTLSVSAAGSGTGTVSPVGAGTTATFAYGEGVTLAATPAPGSAFSGWSGDCAGITTNACSLSMMQSHNVTAIFTLTPPVAHASAPAAANEATTITLDGSASEGLGLNYQWTQILPSDCVGVIVNPNDAKTAMVLPVLPGGFQNCTLTIKLAVTNAGGSAWTTVDINDLNVNHAPVAQTGADQIVKEGTAVRLDGTASFDPDRDPITYQWIQTGGPQVTLAGGQTATPTFTAPWLAGGIGGPSTLEFALLISDTEYTHTASTRVIVEQVNHAPIADAGAAQTVHPGKLVTLDGSASKDPDGDVLAYQWTQVGGPAVILSDPKSTNPTFTTPHVSGTVGLAFQLVVNDGGLASSPAQVVITVKNSPPLCNLAQAVPNVLWPPDHKMVPIKIAGVNDADDAKVSINILGVTQDEPVNGLGDGDTSPDAVIQGSTALIRAERSGLGNGRVYQLHFSADDGDGGACTGAVNVSVPHDKKDTAIDSGQRYDSTLP